MLMCSEGTIKDEIHWLLELHKTVKERLNFHLTSERNATKVRKQFFQPVSLTNYFQQTPKTKR